VSLIGSPGAWLQSCPKTSVLSWRLGRAEEWSSARNRSPAVTITGTFFFSARREKNGPLKRALAILKILEVCGQILSHIVNKEAHHFVLSISFIRFLTEYP